MGGEQMETPRGWQADAGQRDRFSNLAGNENVARNNGPRHSGAAKFRVSHPGSDVFTIEVKGRVRWALDRLREAGTQGCAPITEPAPRWSAYVHDLRGMGVQIETVCEEHGGEFSGTHGRYVLRSAVSRVKGGAT
jgi:hypothetical protein